MSFGITIAATPAAEFDAAALKASDAYQAQLAAQDYALDVDAKNAIAVALTALGAIVATGVVGTGLVAGSIVGHANPGQKPVKGWANDALTVAVYCAEPAAV